MSRIRLYFALLSVVMLFGCVRETLHDMPSVVLEVSWENSRDQLHSDAVFHLYAQFDYLSDPLEVAVVASKSQSLALLPGRYKVLMHSSPCAPLVIDGKASFDDLNASIEYKDGASLSLPQFMVLDANDPAREIYVELGGNNKFEFKPISASKKIRFVINGDDNFGQADLVSASLKGVTSKINLSTLQREQIESISLGKWAVEGKKFTSESIEVLGFDDQGDITLLLVVQSPDSEYPKEQPIDLTKEITEMEGDEIQITMEVEYKPDIRVRKITIREWLAGNEITIPIN